MSVSLSDRAATLAESSILTEVGSISGSWPVHFSP